jgi:hypothetical protein
MHVRSVGAAAVVLAVACIAVAVVPARARAQATDPFADGLVPGDYLRIGVSTVSPVNPQGSLNDWKRGVGLGVLYENWDAGSGGVGRLGYGFMADYSLLPFDDQHFVNEFVGPFGQAKTASAKKAGVFQAGLNIRLRIPAPFIMPSFSLGIGFLDWHPGQITYTASGTTTTQTAKQQHRSGGSASFGFALDKHIYDRFGIFGEAIYTYAYTSFGQGLAGSGSACLTAGCDLLKNTQLGTIRGGLRVKTGK